MKWGSLLILGCLILSTACSPLVPASGQLMPEANQSPNVPPGVGDQAGTLSKLSVQWDTQAQSKIVQASFCCGFVPENVRINYIPDAQIWGDGRIIWVKNSNTGSRQVFVGKITPEALSAILEKAISSGFFNWQELYKPANSPTDMATQCLTIQLKDQQRKVCEYFSGAPPAFHELYDAIAQGAGVTGKEFIPQEGYLISIPLKDTTRLLKDKTIPGWEATNLRARLADAAQGKWMDQKALAAAWEMVNANPWATIVQDGKEYYQITIQLPGISLNEPPVRP